MNDAKPFLKWAGGKSQLLDKFQSLYPAQLREGKVKTYYEPFLGSGAVFFDIVRNFNIKSAYLYDINEELVLTYRVIQQDVSRLLEVLNRLQTKYLKLSGEQRLEFFYEQRTAYNRQRNHISYGSYNDSWLERAAQLIFLNRTCYNGLYRVNSKGEFNTPAGRYAKPTICDEQNLLAVNRALGIAEIKKAHFSDLLKDIQKESFVYFDPPYRPISKTASFKAYSHHGFTDEDQHDLASVFRQLDKQGSRVMLSNSDPKNIDPSDNFFDDIYAEFHITRIPAKRMINANPEGRGSINEIVVTNYPNML